MRVIAGTAGGRKLYTLEGDDVRPTTDKVKEAVFSIIQFMIPGRRFLDLFAGSGQMGIEALSRGASEAVFVDKSRKSIEVITKNLENTGLLESAEVINHDAFGFLNHCKDKFDIAYLDPPYSMKLLNKLLPDVINVMNKGAIVLCEHSADEILEDSICSFKKTKTYKYGKIMLSKYEYNNEKG
jgi:16S rRNA (guanine(966)-N(2))-methyltransferase RsmD